MGDEKMSAIAKLRLTVAAAALGLGIAALPAAALAEDAMSSDDAAMPGDAMSTDTMSSDAMSSDAMSSDAMSSDAMSSDSMSADSMSAEDTVMVGGAAMYPSRNIIENAVNSADHTTLVAAVKAAGLVETLSGPGPFTVFAPTDEAFAKLPAGTVDGLLKPENKDMLVKILTYHVVAGKWSAADIMAKAADGPFAAETVSGDTLTFAVKDGKVWITDESGDNAAVTIADVNQSNGVIHVVDTVLLPK